MPRTYSATSSAAMRISSSRWLSLRNHGLRGRKYFALSKSVSAGFNSRALNQVHLSPYDSRQFFLHVEVVEQIPSHVVLVVYEEVYVAVRPEVIAEYGAEDAKFADLPLAAEVPNGWCVQVDSVCGHSAQSSAAAVHLVLTGRDAGLASAMPQPSCDEAA